MIQRLSRFFRWQGKERFAVVDKLNDLYLVAPITRPPRRNVRREKLNFGRIYEAQGAFTLNTTSVVEPINVIRPLRVPFQFVPVSLPLLGASACAKKGAAYLLNIT